MADDRERIAPVDEVTLLRAAACDGRLSRGDVGVLAVILRHCDSEWLAWPGIRTIAEQARLTTSSVAASLDRLERVGYVRVIRRGQRKRQDYQVLTSPSVPRSAPVHKDSRFGKSAPVHKDSSENPSVPVKPDASVLVDRKDLFRSTGTEGTSEITFEDTGSLIPFEQQQQQRQHERREQIRADYLRARETGDSILVRLMEREGVLRKHILDLIDSGRMDDAA